MKMFTLIIATTLLCATAASAQSTQRGFSVVLLLGETQSTSAGDGLPPAPTLRKALSDVKDFLPYKSYRVLDTQWLRSGSTRMRGQDDQEYDIDLNANMFTRRGSEILPYDPSSGKDGVLIVTFHLQETGAAQNSSEEYGRSIQIADMEKQRASLVALLPAAQGAMVQEQKARIERLDRQIRLARARKLLDSRFEMAPGETVVVGTSKIGGGDKGLVVLLTSVAGGK
jgi:hypothetical protein